MKAEIRRELDRLKATSPGPLTIQRVINAAKDRNNPLHDEFTWDAKEALARNLEHEARALLREYTVVINTPDGPTRIRHFVSLMEDRSNGGGYRVMTEVLSDEVQSEQLIANALSELESFTARYRKVKQLAGVFREIEAVREKFPPHQKRRPPKRGGEARAV